MHRGRTSAPLSIAAGGGVQSFFQREKKGFMR